MTSMRAPRREESNNPVAPGQGPELRLANRQREDDRGDNDDQGRFDDRRPLAAGHFDRLQAADENNNNPLSIHEQPQQNPPCIMSINGLTLDLSSWVRAHPGGPQLLERYHGRDASKAFRAAGHSDAAYSMLLEFSVGGPPREEKANSSGALLMMLVRRGILTTTGYHVLVYSLRLLYVFLDGVRHVLVTCSSSLDLLGLFGLAAVTYQLRRMGVGMVYLWIPTIVAVLNCKSW